MIHDPFEFIEQPLELDAHGYLKQVYQDPSQPVPMRTRAAAIAIEYESLRATAILTDGNFAERLE
jgi:hypothetical protein